MKTYDENGKKVKRGNSKDELDVGDCKYRSWIFILFSKKGKIVTEVRKDVDEAKETKD